MTKEEQQLVEFLLLQYIDGKSSPAEEQQLFSILRREDINHTSLEALVEELISSEPGLVQYKSEEWETILKNSIGEPVQRNKLKVFSRPLIFRWVAAAAITALVAFGSIWLLNQPKKAVEPVSKVVPLQDVSSPATSAAVLTLSNGKKVLLNNAPDGLVTIDAGVKLVKSANGELVYQSGDVSTRTALLSYNTVSNPRGSNVISISLSDGTRVWLNTESTITYPTSFAAKERRVEVTGEAYFEVNHNEQKPFIVKGHSMLVEVLGTHFNINNYKDEPASVTTLLEGSVRVTKDEQAVILKTGQQASVNNGNNSEIAVINDADLKSVMAWKNDLFDFNSAHITAIMRQLARWYNVDVVFEGKVPERHYTGAIRKSVNLSEVIRMIQLAGGARVTIDNKKLVVQEQ